MVFHRLPPTWPQFAAWALCGAAASLGFVAAFAFGPLGLLAAPAGAGVALALGGANSSAVGAGAGVGVWGFVLGWLNRDGPGDVCVRTPGAESCTQQWAPWPFWLAGAVLTAIPVILFAVLRHRSRVPRAG